MTNKLRLFSPPASLIGRGTPSLPLQVLTKIVLVGIALFPHVQAQDPSPPEAEEGRSRAIVAETFLHARTSSPSGSKLGAAATRRSAKQPRYREAAGTAGSKSTTLKKGRAALAQLGVTIWKLRPAVPADQGARMLVHEGGSKAEWTPVRIESGTGLATGDRVRVSIESPTHGYLYVVDREQFSDGSLGDAYLIFPTTRTRNGDNRVRPGKLIDIPAQEDDPNYFTLLPSTGRSDQVGELLTIIISSTPLDLRIGAEALKISEADLGRWEKDGGGSYTKHELIGGAGLTWTEAEKQASAGSAAKYLNREQPAPQTLFRGVSNSRRLMLVNVPLRYGK